MYEYKCKCGYTIKHWLRITTSCPKCDRKLKYIYEPDKTHHIEQRDLPKSQKFIPIYYQDQLWYYRRSPKNTKEAKKEALLKTQKIQFKKKI